MGRLVVGAPSSRPGFCTALAGGQGARTYRDRWREQLNRNVARKLNRLGG